MSEHLAHRAGYGELDHDSGRAAPVRRHLGVVHLDPADEQPLNSGNEALDDLLLSRNVECHNKMSCRFIHQTRSTT